MNCHKTLLILQIRQIKLCFKKYRKKNNICPTSAKVCVLRAGGNGDKILTTGGIMRIGIITAMAEETLPVMNKLGGIVAEDFIAGVRIIQIEAEGHTVYLANSGIGEIRAALAVQMLVDLFDIEAVLNFGFVGSLNKRIPVGEMVIAERAVHHQFDITAVDNVPVGKYDNRDSVYFETSREIAERVQNKLSSPLRKVTVASGDKFVGDSETKKHLHDAFGADISEMELAGICLAAEPNNIPVFSLKVVSDGADENATVSFGEILEKGLTRYEELLPDVLRALAGVRPAAQPPVVRGEKRIVKK